MFFIGDNAFAQAGAGFIYVTTGITFPRFDGYENGLYGGVPGGSTEAWTVGVGVFVTPKASVELEMLGTATLRTWQRPRAGGGTRVVYEEDRRDRSIGINLRLHMSRWRRVQFNPLAGVAFVQHWGWSQLIARNDSPLTNPIDTPVSAPRIRRHLPTDTGITLGFDVRIGSEHVAVVPSYRLWLRVTDRYPPNQSDPTGQYLGGASQWMVTPGVMARIDF